MRLRTRPTNFWTAALMGMKDKKNNSHYIEILIKAQESDPDPNVFAQGLEKRIARMRRKASQPGPIYDAVFHTVVERLGRLVILLINNLFGTQYTGDEQIIQGMTEMTERDARGAYRTVRADSHFTIVGKNGQRRTFHVECQTMDDNTILLRIAEYDLAIARLNSVTEDNALQLMLPDTAVILLRSTEKRRHPWKYRVVRSDGKYVEQEVHVRSIPDTTVDEMFSEHLYALLPFYLLTNGNALRSAEHDRRAQLDLLNQSERIRDRILREVGITQEEKLLLLELTLKVINALVKDKAFKEEISNTMYPNTIELELDKYGDAREAKGREEGRREGRQEGRQESRAEYVSEGIIEMGIAGKLDPALIVSTLSNVGNMTAAEAQIVYAEYMKRLNKKAEIC